jgi:hypothetical protein
VHSCTAEEVQRCRASSASPQAPSQACVCPVCFALIKVVGRVAELAAPRLAAQLPAARLEGEVDEAHVVAGHKGRPTSLKGVARPASTAGGSAGRRSLAKTSRRSSA